MSPRIPVAFRTATSILVILAGLVAVGCGGEEPAELPEAAAAEVRTDTATLAVRDVAIAHQTTGAVEPWRRVSPGTKILGRVDRVVVSEGQDVASGELLVALERRDLEAAVQQAEAGVRVAEARLENVSAQHDRIVALHGRGSATDKDLEDVEAALRMAEAGIDEARAGLETARVTLGYAEVRAPFAGRVVAKHVEEGGMARPGAPLITLEDLSRVKITVQVPESRIVGLAPGDPARVELDALDAGFHARVDRIIPAADRGSRTFDVQLVLGNAEGRMRSGMFARAWFPGRQRQALIVPTSALVLRGQLQGIFVVDDDRIARLRWVQVGGELEDGVEILSGVEAGDTYVVAPSTGMRDGARIVGGSSR